MKQAANFVIYKESKNQIQLGAGYSSDRKSISRFKCFSPSKIMVQNSNSELQFSQMVTQESIAKVLEIQVSFQQEVLPFGILYLEVVHQYLKYTKDSSCSLSGHYYYKISQDVNQYYTYTPQDILSDEGKFIYKNGSNPFFRLDCGDTLVDQFSQFAVLAFSMVIRFRNQASKQKFLISLSLESLGAAATATLAIKDQFQKLNLEGIIEINAIQLGGDPNQLQQIIQNQQVSCNVQDISSCQQTIQEIIKYFTQIQTQMQKDKIGKYENFVQTEKFIKGFNLNEIGLNNTNTFASYSVIDSRKAIQREYSRTRYYLEKIDYLFKNFPNFLNKEFNENLNTLYCKLINNFRTLIKGNDQNDYQNLLDCMNFPQRCSDIYNGIITQLKEINELEIINLMKNFKYIYKESPNLISGQFYPKGGNVNDSQNWFLFTSQNDINYNQVSSQAIGNLNDISFFSVQIDSMSYMAYFNYTNLINYGLAIRYYSLHSQNEGYYIGDFIYCLPKTDLGKCIKAQKSIIIREVNPYYFDSYDQ